jgi:hypothetical protein
MKFVEAANALVAQGFSTDFKSLGILSDKYCDYPQTLLIVRIFIPK